MGSDFRELFQTEEEQAEHRFVRFSCRSQLDRERVVKGLPFEEIKATAARLAKRWDCPTVDVQVARERRAAPHVPYEPGCDRGGLDVWFDEEWVNVCEPDLPPCGRDDTEGMSEAEYRRAYPKCRPRTVAEAMDEEERDAACRRKRRAVRKAGTKVVRVK
jgi:hypothetical protein